MERLPRRSVCQGETTNGHGLDSSELAVFVSDFHVSTNVRAYFRTFVFAGIRGHSKNSFLPMATGGMQGRAKYCDGWWDHLSHQGRTIPDNKTIWICFRPCELCQVSFVYSPRGQKKAPREQKWFSCISFFSEF